MQIINRVRNRWFYRVADFHTFFSALMPSAIITFGNLKFLSLLKGKLRRFLFVHFRKGYVRHQLSIRQGTCRQCGACCSLLFTCPMLTKNDNCLIYNTCRPQACRVFPIDVRDVNDARICGAQCGYSFTRQSSIDN
jgi:hypothetical protein